MDTEMRTIARMILTHRLVEINEEMGGREGNWILNNLSEDDQKEVLLFAYLSLSYYS